MILLRHRDARRSLANSRGVIMVEVLLAVLIITVGLTVVMQSLSQAMGATFFSADYTMASLAADSTMARGLIEYPSISQARSRFGSSLEEDRFRAAVALKGAEGGAEGLKILEVAVSWRSGTKERSLIVPTYVFSKNNPSP